MSLTFPFSIFLYLDLGRPPSFSARGSVALGQFGGCLEEIPQFAVNLI